MNSKQLTILAFKFAGFMVAAYTILIMLAMGSEVFRASLDEAATFPEGLGLFMVIAIGVTGFVSGVVLIWSATSAVKSLEPAAEISLSVPHAIQILGVYFAADAFSNLPGHAQWLLSQWNNPKTNFLYAFENIFLLVLGLYLISRPQSALRILEGISKRAR